MMNNVNGSAASNPALEIAARIRQNRPTPQGPQGQPDATGGSVFRQALLSEGISPQASIQTPSASPSWQDRVELQPSANWRQAASTDTTATQQATAQTAPQATAPARQARPATADPAAQFQPMINEVSRIASQSGYVGVTQQDIMRAYKTGQSFLADYTV